MTDADPEDQAFDRALARDLIQPGDTDMALLSRSVLGAVAQDADTATRPMAEALSDPWPVAGGFAGMLMLMGALGYAAVPLFDGGIIRAVNDFTHVLTQIGALP